MARWVLLIFARRHGRDTFLSTKPILKTWLDQGYAIVASDYQGLGTKGTHPYLATKPASYSTLDAIRAVQNSDFPLSDDIVVIGQSQGAAAAFATAGHAPEYAPELNIKGVGRHRYSVFHAANHRNHSGDKAE